MTENLTFFIIFLTDIYGCPHNLIAHEPSDWVYVLVLYVALQAFILFLQDLLGPRFFVPERVRFLFLDIPHLHAKNAFLFCIY